MLTVMGLAKPSPRPKLSPLYRISTDKANRRPNAAFGLNGIGVLMTILLRNCPSDPETISAVLSDAVSISQANDSEREWAASLMANSEPWITFERDIEATRTFFRASDAELFIAHRRDEACGFLLVRPRGVVSSPYVASLAVAAGERGKGIGSKLLRFAEDRFRSESKHLFICVSSFNTRAKALYERLGYVVVGELKDYIIDGFSEYLLHKRLR
jgi:ribosomal-protein-alanine N-acetyltransferase